ncbi:MAG: hypothetical protein PVH64_02085, partial [Bacillota bacterium]
MKWKSGRLKARRFTVKAAARVGALLSVARFCCNNIIVKFLDDYSIYTNVYSHPKKSSLMYVSVFSISSL